MLTFGAWDPETIGTAVGAAATFIGAAVIGIGVVAAKVVSIVSKAGSKADAATTQASAMIEALGGQPAKKPAEQGRPLLLEALGQIVEEKIQPCRADVADLAELVAANSAATLRNAQTLTTLAGEQLAAASRQREHSQALASVSTAAGRRPDA